MTNQVEVFRAMLDKAISIAAFMQQHRSAAQKGCEDTDKASKAAFELISFFEGLNEQAKPETKPWQKIQ